MSISRFTTKTAIALVLAVSFIATAKAQVTAQATCPTDYYLLGEVCFSCSSGDVVLPRRSL